MMHLDTFHLKDAATGLGGNPNASLVASQQVFQFQKVFFIGDLESLRW